jgi:hypothetical protein
VVVACVLCTETVDWVTIEEGETMSTTNEAEVASEETNEDEVFYAASFIKRHPVNPTEDD